MQNIPEKNKSLQVAHEQRKFEIIHMLQYIQLYITRRAPPYQNGSNRCNLCLEEKIAIWLTLSTREPKLHQNVNTKPSKPKNHQPNEITFNANRLITVL